MLPGIHRMEPWKALSLLITFVVGGFLAPVVHRAEHAVEWSEQQAAAHQHGDSDEATLRSECADVSGDLQDCRLCQRNWIADFLPADGPWLFNLSSDQPVILDRPIPVPFQGSKSIRAPPAQA